MTTIPVKVSDLIKLSVLECDAEKVGARKCENEDFVMEQVCGGCRAARWAKEQLYPKVAKGEKA
jgi:predicted nucleotide-binding protein (sugar kinase/HSP70/actin superfamily)